jgi:hypothetical protein
MSLRVFVCSKIIVLEDVLQENEYNTIEICLEIIVLWM